MVYDQTISLTRVLTIHTYAVVVFLTIFCDDIYGDCSVYQQVHANHIEKRLFGIIHTVARGNADDGGSARAVEGTGGPEVGERAPEGMAIKRRNSREALREIDGGVGRVRILR